VRFPRATRLLREQNRQTRPHARLLAQQPDAVIHARGELVAAVTVWTALDAGGSAHARSSLGHSREWRVALSAIGAM
jgi:hypothetical protein